MKLKGGKMKLLIFIKKIYWLSEKKKAENGRRFVLFTFLCSLLLALLFSQWLETTIYLDSLSGMAYPQAFTYNATNNKIYVSGKYGNCVIVIDGATNRVIATIPVGDGPCALVWNSTNNKVYCANEYSDDVTVIDGSTNQVIAIIPVGYYPYALVWNSTNNKVYCANYYSNNVSVIDGATNQVIATIPVGSAPRAFAWNSIQNRTYVANFGSSTISVIRDVTGIEEYFLPDVKPFASEIYPNPAKSFFVIRSSLPVKEIEIFDVSGKLIKEITFSTKEPKISLNGIKTGVYLLKIKTENKEFTEKLIIK
jgi:YVTN family beta-propeller protein